MGCSGCRAAGQYLFPSLLSIQSQTFQHTILPLWDEIFTNFTWNCQEYYSFPILLPRPTYHKMKVTELILKFWQKIFSLKMNPKNFLSSELCNPVYWETILWIHSSIPRRASLKETKAITSPSFSIDCDFSGWAEKRSALRCNNLVPFATVAAL